MFSSKPKSQNRIDSLIGAGTRIEGTVIFAGGLRVDGEIKGDVRAAEGESGTLVVSEQARIEGEIHVAHLVVNGTIVGPVHATELIELQPRSRVSGVGGSSCSRSGHALRTTCTTARSRRSTHWGSSVTPFPAGPTSRRRSGFRWLTKWSGSTS